MTTRPLVSIILPCFNAERYVTEAIESALSQTYPETEVIVVDDGSTDASPERIAAFGGRIRAVRTANRGAPAARNRGLALAAGTYIQFLDADDALFPEKLARALPAFSETSADVVFGDTCSVFEHEGEAVCHRGPAYPWPVADMAAELVRTNIQTSRGVYRREILERAGGFNEGLERAQDYEFHFRLAVCGARFHYLPGVVGVKYRYHGSSTRISNWRTTRRDPLFDLRLLRHFRQLAEAHGAFSPGVRTAVREKLAAARAAHAGAGVAPDVLHAYDEELGCL